MIGLGYKKAFQTVLRQLYFWYIQKSQELSFPIWLCFLTCKLNSFGCFVKKQEGGCFSFLQFKYALGGNTEDYRIFIKIMLSLERIEWGRVFEGMGTELHTVPTEFLVWFCLILEMWTLSWCSCFFCLFLFCHFSHKQGELLLRFAVFKDVFVYKW